MNHNGGGHRGGRNAKRPRPDGSHHSHSDRGNPHKRARDNNNNNNSNKNKNRNNNNNSNGNSQPSTSASAPNLSAITDLPSPLPPLPPIQDPTNARLAFTHTSVTNYQMETYDRLEWYGDSVIEMVATDLLWDMYPSLPGGRLSQMRESLVNNARLASFARAYGFDDIVDGSNSNNSDDKNNNNNNNNNTEADPPTGERRLRIDPLSWAHAGNRAKILGDVFEAYVGAVALDDRAANRKGKTPSADPPADRASPLLRALWTPLLLSSSAFADENDRAQEAVKMAATRAFAPSGCGLKAWYEDVGDMAYENKAQQRFTVAFYVRGWGYEKLKLGEGVGQSKKVARARAAQDALDRKERGKEGGEEVREFAGRVEAYLAEKRAKREAEEAEKAGKEEAEKGKEEVERGSKEDEVKSGGQ